MSHPFNNRDRSLLLGLSLLAAGLQANAADISWRRPEGGTFSSGGGWFGGVAPGAGDIAHFGLSTPGPLGNVPPYTVSFSALASNIRLLVEDDFVVFDLNGLVYETTNTAIGMAIGTVAGTTGQLTVTDGIVTLPFQSDLEIASTAGGGGSLVVGAGGKVLGTMDLLVGLNGAGALLINNNGDLIADDATLGLNSGVTGTATITGGGSSLLAGMLVVGSSGTGVLNVNAGGQVDSASGVVGDLAGSTGTANVDGVGSRWENAGTLFVGRGTLNVTGGGSVSSAIARIGGSGVGTVAVDGVGSRWDTNSLSVGFFGNGTLTITAGGTVHAGGVSIGASSTAAVTVDGAGSLLDSTSGIIVGNFGSGTLSVANGGLVLSTGSTIGDLATGHVTVSGAGSRWQNDGALTVGGSSGSNTLEITAAGVVNNFAGTIGRNANSSGHVRVDGSGSLWHNSQLLTIGDHGEGTLEIANGGVVESLGAVVGVDFGSTSTGLVTVVGTGSLWNNNAGAITIGSRGDGAIIIADGGRVITGGAANIGQQQSSTGTVIISSAVATADSTWEIGGRLSLSLNPDPLTSQGLGTVRIQPGGKVTVGQDTVVASGDLLSLEGGTLATAQIRFERFGSAGTNFQWTSGTLHVGTFNGDLNNQAGILAPGMSVGSTNITGNYNQSGAATLQIEVWGTIDHDVVNVNGQAFLGGDLEIVLVNGFVPNSANTIAILDTALGIVSSFDNVANGQRLLTSDGLGSFLVNYGFGSPFDDDQVVLSAFQPAINGDFDLDGDVDGADVLVWQRGGSPNPNSVGDLAAWKSNFGFGAATPATAAVPEPGSAALLFITLVISEFASNMRRRTTARGRNGSST